MSDLTPVILAEYNAIRSELLFFLDAQRRNINMLITASVGQIGFLFLNSDRIESQVLIYVYLFLFPFLIFVLMLKTLENTSKILIAADYIHKGIKKQLTAVLPDTDRFFEWEEHKGKTARIDKKTLFLLDMSKWSVFIIGLILSFVSAYWLSEITKPNTATGLHFVIAMFFDGMWILICLRFSFTFNEVQGESRFDDNT